MEKNIFDCTDYASKQCLKGIVLPSKNTFNENFNFITFGCWGVYCIYDEINVAKLNKETNTIIKDKKVYGSKIVAKTIEQYCDEFLNEYKQPINAILISGDNVYSKPYNDSMSIKE